MVVGVLNFDLNTQNNIDNNSLNYLQMMSSNGFCNIIEMPTRYGDHLFVDNLGNSMLSCTIDLDLLAYHQPIAGFN